MKVEFNTNITGAQIGNLNIGETFLDTRRGSKEKAIYMVVDSHSGLAEFKIDCGLAINLETGQLKRYRKTAIVTPVKAKVIFEREGF